MMMRISNLAFHNNTDAYRSFTPEDCLRKMFAHTGADGHLMIPVWSYGIPDEDKKEEYYAMKMNWTQKDCESTIEAFRTLYDQIKAMASFSSEINGDAEKAKQFLNEELLATWNQYLRPFAIESVNTEEIQRLNEKEMFISLSAKEAAVLNEYRKNFRAQCGERIGDRYCAVTELIQVRRLCKLFELDAPKFILCAEARILAQAMAVQRYATAFEIVKEEG